MFAKHHLQKAGHHDPIPLLNFIQQQHRKH